MKINTYLSLYNYRGTQFLVVCVWNLGYCSGYCRTAPSTFLILLALRSYTWFSRRCSAFWWCEYLRYGVLHRAYIFPACLILWFDEFERISNWRYKRIPFLKVDWNVSSANADIILMEMGFLLNVEVNFSLLQFIYQLGPLFWLAPSTALKHVASLDMGGLSTWEPWSCSEKIDKSMLD